MKKLAYSFIALTLLSSAISCADEAKAVTTASKKDFTSVKIAVMDPYGVLDKSKEWEVQAEAIKTDIETRAKTIQSMETEYKKKQSELANMGAAATAKAKEDRLLSLQNRIEIEQRAAQEIPQQRAQMAQMEILKKIEAAAQKIAKEHGVDVVLAGSTIYVADRVDITQMVVDEINKSFKPAAKPATPAPAKKS